MQVKLVTNVLKANDALAGRNRQVLRSKNIFTVNLMSSPGSGKTTILEKTIDALKGRLRLAVIEGDLYTTRDADRIEKKGVPVLQINTRGGCHLDANMVSSALDQLDLEAVDLLFIENVGNLVCPASYDLGEDARALVLAVTEGNDKPEKYPMMFRDARVVLVNKIDLLPYTDFSLEELRADAKKLNPQLEVLPVSARTGSGIEKWAEWLVSQNLQKAGVKTN